MSKVIEQENTHSIKIDVFEATVRVSQPMGFADLKENIIIEKEFRREVANAIYDFGQERKERFDSDKFIDNVCLSYRHDFGLLAEQDKQRIRFECKEWMRAIQNNWEHYKPI